MSPVPCARTWQVEAARDGRLSGKDLESALRHREHCAECTNEQRRLDGLGRELVALPELPRDPLVVRRARQQLMTEVNRSFLNESPQQPTRRWGRAWILPAAALGFALGYALFFAGPSAPPASTPTKSAIEVHAAPGARWHLHSDSEQERVELKEGAASFQVYAHPGRRVLVRLPDGEIEDQGTVFDVAVSDEHTQHIAVSEGRIAIRLSNQPEFSLGAGEHWQRPAPAAVTDPVTPAQDAPTSPRLDATPVPRKAHRSSEPPAAPRPAAVPAASASTRGQADSSAAEDAAYLKIVSLLREQRTAEARAQAKAYLLRFPNGFRRVEVLNVATSADAGAP